MLSSLHQNTNNTFRIAVKKGPALWMLVREEVCWFALTQHHGLRIGQKTRNDNSDDQQDKHGRFRHFILLPSVAQGSRETMGVVAGHHSACFVSPSSASL
jgi:hypothetical protein